MVTFTANLKREIAPRAVALHIILHPLPGGGGVQLEPLYPNIPSCSGVGGALREEYGISANII